MMLSMLKKWLKPPMIPGDIEKTRLAQILDKILYTAWGIQFICFFVYPGDVVTRLILMATMGISAIILQVLLHRGYFKIANLGFLIFYWFMVTIVALITGGPTSPAISAYCLLVLWTVISVGRRGSILIVAASIASGLGMALAINYGLASNFTAINPPLTLWGVQSFLLIVLALITGFFTGGLRYSYRETHSELSQRIKTEQELQRFKALSDQARDIFLILDSKTGRILYGNHAALNQYGYESAELLSMYFQDLKAKESYPPPKVSIEQDPEGGVLFESIHRCKDGSTFPVEVSSIQFNMDGENNWISIIRDITERKQAERELQQLNSELEKRVHDRTIRLEAMNKELETFNYSVSHDLRAPLRNIKGFVRALMEDYSGSIPQEGQDYLNRIQYLVTKMDQLINDLLRLSRLGRKPLEYSLVDLKNIASSAWEDLKCETDGRIIHVTINDISPHEADPLLIKQVYINLLSNAIKYTRPRAVAEILIGSTCQENGRQVYWVKDNGVGFNMAYIDKLFGVFQRLHSEAQFEGSGVGLAIVQRIIHLHHGQVWAEAKEDSGAKFFFTLGE